MSETEHTESGDWRETFANQLFRIFKVCRIHDLENDAARNSLADAAETFRELLGREVDYLDIIFAGDNIFANGRPLRSSRETYETLLELGDLLDEIGFNEVTIRPGVDQGDLEAMLRAYMDLRNRSTRSEEAELTPADTVRFRRVDPQKILELEETPDRTAREQVLRLYPAAVVTMRRFLEELREGEVRALRFAKRFAQRFVALSDSESETLLAVSAMKETRDEAAGIAVNSAILSLLMARRLTDDYRTLQRVCFTAMVADIGRPRAAGIYDQESTPNVIPKLTNEGKERLGSLNALMLLKNARMRDAALRRATVGYEAGWLEHKESLGWPWGESPRPTVEALIIEATRRFWDGMALKPSMKERRPPSEVFEGLRRQAETKVERAIVDLLMETVGYFETGTIVETSTGWKGVVVRAAEEIPMFSRPLVRMVRDANGNAVDPEDLDLADGSLDLEQFGVVARRISSTNDRKLMETAREVRPDDWGELHREPRRAARPSNRRVLASDGTGSRSRAPSPATGAPSSETDEEGTTGAPAASEGDRSRSAERAQRPNSRTGDEAVPEADLEPDTGGPSRGSGSGGEEPAGEDSEAELVLEFGPGSATPTSREVKPIPEQKAERRGEDDGDDSGGESVGPEIRGSSPDEIRGVDGSEQPSPGESGSAEPPNLEELSDGHIEPADEESIPEIDEVDPVEPEVEEISEVEPLEEPPPESDGLEEMAGEIDRSESSDHAPTRRVDSDAQGGMLRDYVDSIEGDAPAEGDRSDAAPSESSLGEMAADLDAREQNESGATEAISSERSRELLDDFVDQDPDDSRLGEMAADLDDESAEVGGTTEAISSEKSREMLESFVEESRDPDDSRLGEMAADLDEASVEETATEAISSEQSREILEDFVEEESEASGPSDDSPADSSLGEMAAELDEASVEETATEAISSEQSREILEDFVEEESEAGETSGRAAESSRLGEMASELEEASVEDSGATEALSPEESREVLESFVEEESESTERDDASPGGDADSDTDGGTKRISQEESREILDSFTDSEAADSPSTDHEETSGEDRLEEIADELDDAEDEPGSESDETRQISDEASNEKLRDYIDGLDSD